MKRRIENGFTLIEVLFGTALLSIILGISLSAIQTGQNVSSRGMSQGELDERARKMVERIAVELRQARADSLFPVAFWDINSLSFDQAEGFANGVAIWGDTINYTLVYAPGEADNGQDDNGNGLVDEQLITRDQGGVTIDYIYSVREGGMSFSRDGDTVTISLTLQGLDAEQRLIERTVQTAIQLRN